MLAVQTREQTRKRHEERRREQELDADSNIHLSPTAQPEDTEETTTYLSELDKDLFAPAREERKKPTCSQKRDRRSTFASAIEEPHPLDGGAGQLKAEQQQEPTLREIRNSADDPESEFEVKDDLLYRKQRMEGAEEVVEQLVLPTKYRDAVLRTAHAIPLAGHLG